MNYRLKFCQNQSIRHPNTSREISRDGGSWTSYKGIRYSCRTGRERLKVPGNRRGTGRLKAARLNPKSLRVSYLVDLRLRDHRHGCSRHIRNKKKFFLLHNFSSNLINSQQFRKTFQCKGQQEVYPELVRLLAVKRYKILLIQVSTKRKSFYKQVIPTTLKKEAILRFI